MSAGPDPHDGDPTARPPLRIAKPETPLTPSPSAPSPAAPSPSIPSPLPPGVAELEQWACRIELPRDSITGTSLVAKYDGIPANQPSAYGNFFALWEGTVVPWTAPPIATAPVATDATRGSTLMEKLSLAPDDYTVAYAVGDAIGDIAATVTFDGDGNTVRERGIELTLDLVDDGIVSLHYRTPPGYRPAKWGNWVAIYRGEASPYDPPEPVARTDVPDVNEGELALTKLPLTAGNAYTVAYFTKPAPTTAAATLMTFRLARR